MIREKKFRGGLSKWRGKKFVATAALRYGVWYELNALTVVVTSDSEVTSPTLDNRYVRVIGNRGSTESAAGIFSGSVRVRVRAWRRRDRREIHSAGRISSRAKARSRVIRGAADGHPVQ